MKKTQMSKKTILIADDEPINVKILNKILMNAGLTTITAYSGEKCVDKAKQFKPDLILLDIKMPVINGIQTCKILKQEGCTQNIPIIFVTADTSESALKEAFASGGTDFVRKPVNVTELIARVESVLFQQELIQEHAKNEKLKGALEMAGGICHELNQPLQYISGASQVLLMDLPQNSPEHKQVLKMKAQIDRMAATTRKLVGITSLESRKYVGDARIVDIEKSKSIVSIQKRAW